MCNLHFIKCAQLLACNGCVPLYFDVLLAIRARMMHVCACNENISPNRLDNISLAASVRAEPTVFEYFITHDPRKRNKLMELRLGDAS